MKRVGVSAYMGIFTLPATKRIACGSSGTSCMILFDHEALDEHPYSSEPMRVMWMIRPERSGMVRDKLSGLSGSYLRPRSVRKAGRPVNHEVE